MIWKFSGNRKEVYQHVSKQGRQHTAVRWQSCREWGVWIGCWLSLPKVRALEACSLGDDVRVDGIFKRPSLTRRPEVAENASSSKEIDAALLRHHRRLSRPTRLS